MLKIKNLFKRQIFFPKCIDYQIFLDTQLSYNHWGRGLGITKLSNP